MHAGTSVWMSRRGACNVAFIKDWWKTCDREISWGLSLLNKQYSDHENCCSGGGRAQRTQEGCQLMWICIIQVRNNVLFWLGLSFLSHVSFMLWWYRISHVPWIYCIPLDSIFFVNVTSSVWSLLFYSKKFLLNLHDPVFWLPLSC